MNDIHSKIPSIVEVFASGCALNKIPHYYDGHTHHSRGINLIFVVRRITTEFFRGLKLHFDNFTIRYDAVDIVVVIKIFEDDDLPF